MHNIKDATSVIENDEVSKRMRIDRVNKMSRGRDEQIKFALRTDNDGGTPQEDF